MSTRAAQFDRQGYVVVPHLISDDDVAEARAAAARIIAAFEQPEPTRPDPPSAAPEPNEPNEDTQTQSWEDIKEAMLGTASESDASTEEQPEPVSHEEEILFDFVNNHDGLIVDLSWSSKLEGDKMKGEIWFDADGNTGEVPLNGTKK